MDDATLNVIMVWIAMLIVGCAIYLMIADREGSNRNE
jgi:hypothetical protein